MRIQSNLNNFKCSSNIDVEDTKINEVNCEIYIQDEKIFIHGKYGINSLQSKSRNGYPKIHYNVRNKVIKSNVEEKCLSPFSSIEGKHLTLGHCEMKSAINETNELVETEWKIPSCLLKEEVKDSLQKNRKFHIKKKYDELNHWKINFKSNQICFLFVEYV